MRGGHEFTLAISRSWFFSARPLGYGHSCAWRSCRSPVRCKPVREPRCKLPVPAARPYICSAPAEPASAPSQRGTITLSGGRVENCRTLHRDPRWQQHIIFRNCAAKLEAISFIARPSRVPAAASGAVLGSAFLFDRFQNLVLTPGSGDLPAGRREALRAKSVA